MFALTPTEKAVMEGTTEYGIRILTTARPADAPRMIIISRRNARKCPGILTITTTPRARIQWEEPTRERINSSIFRTVGQRPKLEDEAVEGSAGTDMVAEEDAGADAAAEATSNSNSSMERTSSDSSNSMERISSVR